VDGTTRSPAPRSLPSIRRAWHWSGKRPWRCAGLDYPSHRIVDHCRRLLGWAAGVNPADALADDTQWRNAGQFQRSSLAGTMRKRQLSVTSILGKSSPRGRCASGCWNRKAIGAPVWLTADHRCQFGGIGGIVVYQHLGDDPALPVDLRSTHHRISDAGAHGRRSAPDGFCASFCCPRPAI